jgi:RNA polymerase sigma-70 factor (ECF subfamily)
MRAQSLPEPEAPPPRDFRSVFESELRYVWNSLRRLGVAPRDLEDLTQQVFLQVYGQLAKLDPARPLRPWLFSFAFHAASNYRRLARHRVELAIVPPDFADAAPGAEEQLIEQQEKELAELALLRVPLERRAVLLMHEVDGHAMPEIARVLSLPVNTAYSRLRLAREDYQDAVHLLRRQRGES